MMLHEHKSCKECNKSKFNKIKKTFKYAQPPSIQILPINHPQPYRHFELIRLHITNKSSVVRRV